MVDNTLIEGALKFRDGKKVSARWNLSFFPPLFPTLSFFLLQSLEIDFFLPE